MNNSITRYNTDPAYGLNSQIVNERFLSGANNKKVSSSTQTVGKIIRTNVLTYFNLVFAILGILLMIVGAWSDMLFLPVIIANTCIGIFQELNSKRVLDKLSILNAPKTKTMRDGRVIELPSEHLVLDDIVILEAGSQIPADAIVVEGEVAVNEALITGESDEIIKRPGDALLSGSFIVSGAVKARLDKVGADSYVSKLTIEATASKKGEQSEMIRSLNNLILVMGIMIIPIGICLFVQSYMYNESSFHDSITSMVAAVIGMIPEGLYLLSSVAMAVSTMRLAKRKVLVHDMKCIETLARVNVLCVDKTGTITEPGMQVYQFEAARSSKSNENSETNETNDIVDKGTLSEMISNMVLNMPKDNATMEALQEYFASGTGKRASQVFSFSSQTKFSGAVIDDTAFVLGAPEFILKDDYHKYEEQIKEYSMKGFRVLVFAKYDGQLSNSPLEKPAKALGFIMLANPIRKGAKETFKYFVEHDVEIKVISGDNPLTVSAIAGEAGILNNDKYIDTSLLQTEEDFYNAVSEYTIFGRVTPDQKRKLVKALKKHKKTVAMTGDGVNDVLALKDADCSVAMASGSDAAANASQLVLLDSDFSRMPSVVMEGRRVVNNIERTAALYIVKNIFSMLLAIFSVILMLDYPLEPSQISLISMFTIGIPSFILALEPNKNPIKGRFLANVIVKALPAGLTDFLVVSGLVIFCREFDVDPECLSTSCTILVAIVGFMILHRIAKPMKLGHIVMMIGLIGGWLYCMIFVSKLFAITSVSKQCAMLMVVFAIITEPALRYFSIIVEWIHAKFKKLIKAEV